MYAIIEDSGSQLKAEVGAVLTVDLRALPTDAKTVTFDRVLMVGGESGLKIGTPYVSGATVTADVIEADFKDRKVEMIKYKRRKGSRTKQGHRQRYMKVKVSAIKG